jgi:hypothetical protein
MSQQGPKTLTNEELKKQIITADYGGKEWKEICLNELVDRNITFTNWLRKTFTK